ncbi:MAG: molybdate ABC transporter permease subunit [Magnetococcus sp. DMHC-6]
MTQPWLSVEDFAALRLSVQLATMSTFILLLFGTPLAWWLAHSKARIRVFVEAVVAVPLVLPPTVLGFYLLILISPNNWFGAGWLALTGRSLAFSFSGLVLASVLYSLPFVVQPLQRTFEQIGRRPLEAAWVLGATPLEAFFSVALPLAVRGYLTATVLGFAHTLGEFGVVLMVGGNIPGQTQVLSIVIYDHVENLAYGQAHRLSGLLLGLSFLVLLGIYGLQRRHSGSSR